MLRRGDSLRERWRGSDRSFTTRTPDEERESLQRNTLRRSFSRKIRRYVKYEGEGSEVRNTERMISDKFHLQQRRQVLGLV